MATLEEKSPAGARRVRNMNNRAEIHLRHKIVELNREVFLRMHMIEMECLDWKSFLKDLKSCNSDDMSEFAPLFVDDEEPMKGMRTRLSQLFSKNALGIDKVPQFLDYQKIKSDADKARNVLSELDLPRAISLPEFRMNRLMARKSSQSMAPATALVDSIPEEEQVAGDQKPQTAEDRKPPPTQESVDRSSALITRINTHGPEVAPGRTVSLARAKIMPSSRATAMPSTPRETSKPFPAIVSPTADANTKEDAPKAQEMTLPLIDNTDSRSLSLPSGAQTERGTLATRGSSKRPNPNLSTRRRESRRRRNPGFMRTLLDSNADRFKKKEAQPLETRIQDFYAKIDPLIIKSEAPELYLPPLEATQET